jgi:calcineurin-like phosphoesterase family protein
MRELFFTADTHFGHYNIMKYSNRPFITTDEMDEVLIENINKTVGRENILYHLGDWSFRDPISYRKRIHTPHIYLVFGNHDKKLRYDKKALEGFRWAGDVLQMNNGNDKFFMSHYAHRTWDRSHYGMWHLYGHSHGSLPDDPNSLSFDVGVDCWSYRPISLEEVRTKMATKLFSPIDHHGKRDFENENSHQ